TTDIGGKEAVDSSHNVGVWRSVRTRGSSGGTVEGGLDRVGARQVGGAEVGFAQAAQTASVLVFEEAQQRDAAGAGREDGRRGLLHVLCLRRRRVILDRAPSPPRTRPLLCTCSLWVGKGRCW